MMNNGVAGNWEGNGMSGTEMSRRRLNYVKRFGTMAVEKGYITIGQLVDALADQAREEAERKTHRLLGSILFEKDYITGEQLQQLVDTVLGQSVIMKRECTN